MTDENQKIRDSLKMAENIIVSALIGMAMA